LNEESSNEAELRTAISRTYFAAFLYIREWLKNQGLRIPRSAEAHLKVEEYIGTFTNRSIRDFFSSLRRRYRNKADYEILTVIRKTDADEAIQIAKRVIESFK
ncbi:MAG: HEPN domain-containing protein, partial [Candidatus Helarchaeota archaeon]